MKAVARYLLPVARAVPFSRLRRLGNWQPATGYLTAAALLILLIAPTAFACPVCWGAPDDPMVKGVNSGIWVLLGLIGFVQLGFVAMFYSFWRKAREHKRFRESLRVIEGGPHA